MYFCSLDSEAFKQGYYFGEKVDLNQTEGEYTPPANYSEKEISDWHKGVSAAITDRLS